MGVSKSRIGWIDAEIAERVAGAKRAKNAATSSDQTNRRANRAHADDVEVLAGLMERFDTHALPVLDRWANPGLLANDLEDLEVPFPHGELLLGLDRPTSPARQTAISRLRRHAERG